MLNHKGTLEIETDRLVLRRFTVNDAENMFNNWANDSEVTKYLSWKPHGKIDTTKDILNSWVQDYESTNVYNWAIVYKNDGMVIGSISVVESSEEHQRCEIGYCIGKKYWSMGISTEALKAVIWHALFDVGFNRVQATHNKENPASGKVMLKTGMIYEGRLRDYRIDNKGQFVDCDMYAILKNDIEQILLLKQLRGLKGLAER